MTIHLKPAEAAITEDDAFIAEALKNANVPTLMMSIIHITGDMGLFEGKIKPKRTVNGDYENSISEEEKTQVRAQALEVLKAYRERGCTLPPPPSERQIHAMMSFLVGEQIPQEYVPMMMEELALDGIDSRAFHWDKPVTTEQKQKFKVLVIGAGMSGLLAAIRLEEAGIPYIVVEKNEAVGGTWVAPGSKTAIRDAGWILPTTFTLSRLSPTTDGHTTSRAATNSLPISTASPTRSEFARTSAFPPRWPALATPKTSRHGTSHSGPGMVSKKISRSARSSPPSDSSTGPSSRISLVSIVSRVRRGIPRPGRISTT
jgi:hypothetical protein